MMCVLIFIRMLDLLAAVVLVLLAAITAFWFKVTLIEFMVLMTELAVRWKGGITPGEAA